MQDVKVKAGETALFECFITGPHTVDVDWLTNGKLIQPALFDCKMQFDGHRCRLLFKSAHEDDSGSYSCKISSAKGRSRNYSPKLSIAQSCIINASILVCLFFNDMLILLPSKAYLFPIN